MEQFIIQGGKPLCGKIMVDTAKNASLPIIAGTILTDEKIVLKNLPNISDVNKMLEILRTMGASIKKEGRDAIVDTSTINKTEIPSELAKEIRSSIFMLGPLLSKYRKATVAYPGGCDIGSRPIDLPLGPSRPTSP